MTAPAPPARGFDPEAEQEVDFARYVRLLAVRWWLLAAGLVAGAVIGFLISLSGGNQVYSATATVLGGRSVQVFEFDENRGLAAKFDATGGQVVITRGDSWAWS